MPGDHVEGRMIDLGLPQIALKFCDDAEVALDVFVNGDGRQEVARVGEAVRADRPEFGQPELRAVIFADVASRLAVGQFDQEPQPARQNANFARRDLQHSKLRADRQSPHLRNDERLAVGVVKEAVAHRGVASVEVNPGAGLAGEIAAAGHRDQTVDEIGWRRRYWQRVPAQLIRRDGRLIERRTSQQSGAAIRNLPERLVRDRRADAVGPRPAVGRARRGERRTAERLGVKSVSRLLRRGLSDRQGARNRFGGELIAESRLILYRHKIQSHGGAADTEMKRKEVEEKKRLCGPCGLFISVSAAPLWQFLKLNFRASPARARWPRTRL